MRIADYDDIAFFEGCLIDSVSIDYSLVGAPKVGNAEPAVRFAKDAAVVTRKKGVRQSRIILGGTPDTDALCRNRDQFSLFRPLNDIQCNHDFRTHCVGY